MTTIMQQTFITTTIFNSGIVEKYNTWNQNNG